MLLLLLLVMMMEGIGSTAEGELAGFADAALMAGRHVGCLL